MMTPGLFGQKHSSRNYSLEESWGKNQFNSSFPASMVAYMSYKDLMPVYLYTGKDNSLQHGHISGRDIFGIDPMSDDAYYNFEAGYAPYERFYSSEREKIDLVMMNNSTNEIYNGLEVKLTALPDNTTRNKCEVDWGTEIVVRPPTICFLACSICAHYSSPAMKDHLREMLGVPKIDHWEEAREVLPHYNEILSSILAVSSDMSNDQSPLIIQPIWKTEGNKMRLKDDCLDVFVWSNLSVIQMCCIEDSTTIGHINRFQRTIIWIYKMLLEYVTYNSFDYKRIIRLLSYNLANDKAFSLPGNKSHFLLSGNPELIKPRISKYEIKNIILGGGQNLLSPERRFDAVLVNSPELFD